MIITAAQRVWLDLYLSKKSILEECLKVNLNSIGKNPTLDQLRPVLAEPALKVWISFIEGEKKLPDKIQSHIQAKLQRVTGGFSTMTIGLSRVVTLKKIKKDIPRLSAKEVNETIICIGININRVKEFCERGYRNFFRSNEQRHHYLYSEWLRIEKDLLRERALWGDVNENPLNKWKLDFTEGPNRQRKRLLPNTHDFYRHYPYHVDLEEIKPNRKYKKPYSIDSKEYSKQFRVHSLLNYYSEKINVEQTLSIEAFDEDSTSK